MIRLCLTLLLATCSATPAPAEVDPPAYPLIGDYETRFPNLPPLVFEGRR